MKNLVLTCHVCYSCKRTLTQKKNIDFLRSKVNITSTLPPPLAPRYLIHLDVNLERISTLEIELLI